MVLEQEGYYDLAVVSDGTVVAWEPDAPVLPPLSSVVAISADSAHALALQPGC
jgi:hypothetical protein